MMKTTQSMIRSFWNWCIMNNSALINTFLHEDEYDVEEVNSDSDIDAFFGQPAVLDSNNVELFGDDDGGGRAHDTTPIKRSRDEDQDGDVGGSSAKASSTKLPSCQD